jgi:hypothetical protein
MPGNSETTTPAPQDPQLFFQDPTGCIDFNAHPSRIPPRFPYPPAHPHNRGAPPGRTHVKDRCRFRLASVSACEHPNPTSGGRGLLPSMLAG